MSHFYGKVIGNRGPATRGGSKNSGYISQAASWEGAVEVNLFYNEEYEEDWAIVKLIPWQGNGSSITLYTGPVSGRDFETFKRQ